MKIALFGATGFIGKVLVKAIQDKGWEALLVDIRKDSSGEENLKTADAAVNVAGHPVCKNRWNAKIKSLIHDSR